MTKCEKSKLHWNYLLALERDLEVVSRYVEFCERNFQTFSVELAHLLFASASETDVVAKLYCAVLDPSNRHKNMDDYRKVITKKAPEFANIQVLIPRYGITLTPWESWSRGNNPDWWHSYNNVKHERDKYFSEATLLHTLNAVAALLVVTFEYYHSVLSLSPFAGRWDTLTRLRPGTTLLRLPHAHFILDSADY